MVELMIVVGIIVVIIAAAIPTITTMLRESHVRQAYEAVLTQMRQAREVATDRHRVVKLTFNPIAGGAPANIVFLEEDVVIDPVTLKHTYQAVPVTNTNLGGNPLTVNLPSDMNFILPATLPTKSPDTLGAQPKGSPPGSPTDYGYNSSSSGGLNVMYFQANGQVLENAENGPVADGVIYVGRAGDPTSNRAVSILGSTGRIKGWRLDNTNIWVIY